MNPTPTPTPIPITVQVIREVVAPRGNWNSPADWIPRVEVDQAARVATVHVYETEGRQERASVATSAPEVRLGADGEGARVGVEVAVRNWRNPQCSGHQTAVWVVFVGDGGHVYAHRPPATKGWRECDPAGAAIRRRLAKLGGARAGTIQQGDLLWVPANGDALPAGDFRHEEPGLGHHCFARPLLMAWGGRDRHLLVEDGRPCEVVHRPATGATHPPVVLPPGQWLVRTTARSLRGGGQD